MRETDFDNFGRHFTAKVSNQKVPYLAEVKNIPFLTNISA